jgi:hypothetical protein
MDRHRHRRGSDICRLTITLAFVVLAAAGCGTTPTPSASVALPPETTTETTVTTTETTAPVPTVVPTPTTRAAPVSTSGIRVPRPTIPVPRATILVRATPIPRPSLPSPVPGADPVIWTGVFCGGLADVIDGVSAISNADPTPQGQKDELLKFSDMAQQAFANTAQKLTQLGPPGITDGKQVQDTAVSFFTTAAATVADQRAKLAALDANDPDFVQEASNLAGPDLSGANAQMQGLTSNQELVPAFIAAPECQRLAH